MIFRTIDDPVTRFELLHYEPLGVCPTDTVLDLGANVGAFARQCIERGAKVIAVEPDACNFGNLAANLPDVACLNLAVGRKLESRRLHRGEYNTTHSLHAGPMVSGEWRMVTTVPLPVLVQHLKPTVIKCDVEGAEWELDWYCLEHVRSVAIEFHYWLPQSDIRSVLQSQGFHLDYRGPITICGVEVWFR